MAEVNPRPGTSNEAQSVAAIEGILAREEGEPIIEEAPEEEAEVESTDEAEAEHEDESEEEESEADEDEAELDEEAEEPDEDIENLEQLAEATGRSVEDLMEALKTTIQVDGEASEVTLSELKAGYQKDRDYRQKTESLKREREQWEQERANYAQSVEQQHQVAAYILNSQEQAIAQSMDSEEMARLKATNPQEWMLKRTEFQDRLQQFQQLKHEAAQRLQQFNNHQQQEQMATLQQKLAQERETLSRDLPNLDTATLSNYLTSEYGFTAEEVGQVYDSRLVKMAEKARLFDQQKAQAEVTTKKVKRAPKAPKPSKTQSAAKVKRSELSKVKARLKKTGKLEDAAEWALKSGLV